MRSSVSRFSKRALANKAKIIMHDAEWLAEAADKEEHHLLAETEGIVTTTELAMLIISLMPVWSVGIATALKIGRMISGPIIAMTDTMSAHRGRRR